MQRVKPWAGLMVLVALGCAPAPGAPRGSFALPNDGDASPGASGVAAEGFGLQALGTNDFIVKLRPAGKKKGKRPRLGAKKRDMLDGSEVFSAASEADVWKMLAELGADPDVAIIEPDYPLELSFVPNDPDYGLQWYLPKINMPTAWDTTQGGAGVTIAVVDSGVDVNHPDLAGKLAPGGQDFYAGDMNPDDEQGHGTHVAGIAAAITNNATGVSGVAPNCPILAIRAGDASLPTSAVTDGINHAVAQGAKVINLSLGSGSDSLTMRAAIDQAVGAGVVVVAAAGNSNTTTVHYPAGDEAAIAVGATDATDKRATFSNHGAWVEIAAPGVGIHNTTFDGAYGVKQGTSMAAPVVAGAAALLRTLRPTWTVEQIGKALMTTGAPVTGFTGNPAIKRVNVQAALAAAMPADLAATFSAITCTPAMYDATFSWKANEPIQPSITISTNPTLAGGTTTSDPTFTTRPGTFSVTGLVPGTKYYYRVSGTDPNGNVTNSAIKSFTTKGITLTGFKLTKSAYQPVLSYNTNAPCTTEILVGTAPGSLTSKVGPTVDQDMAHQHALTGLKPGTTYYYQVKIWDAFGNLISSPVMSFKTSPMMVTTVTSATTPYAMAIAWVSTVPAMGTISYGTTSTSLPTTTAATPLGMNHHVDIPSLLPSTTYYFKVTITDPASNTTSSKVVVSRTKGLEVKEAAASSRTPTTARVTWLTNVLATSEVWMGTSSASLAAVASDATPKRAHDMTLTGLTPNTNYYLKVKGQDAGGLTLQSQVFTVRTLP